MVAFFHVDQRMVLQGQAAKKALAAELAATGIDPEVGKKVRNNLGRPNFLFNFGN
jgi:hypothetical protein